MSYIGECAAGFVCAGRDGKIYIKQIGKEQKEIPLNLFKTYKFSDEYKISKVAYENGIESFKYGDETRNTLWINQENIFITEEEQVKNIYNELNGLTINSFEGTTIIDPKIDMGDLLIIDGKPIIYQGEMSFNGRFIADIKSKISIKQKQETTVKKTSQKLINRRVQSRINEAEGKIEQLIEENTETSQKLTEHEQTIDSIKDTVSHIEELTNTITGLKTITLENCVEGDVVELHIFGNNTVFDYLYPSDDLYPSNDLFPYGDSRIIITNEEGTSVIYELGVKDVLRQNGEVKDEYILQNGKAQIIRRVNKDGTIKTKEEIENLGDYAIELFEGKNIITIQNYTAQITVKYVVKNSLTDVYATRVEMHSSIEQTADEINMEVRKKVDENEVISKINQSAEQVQIDANKISLKRKRNRFNW